MDTLLAKVFTVFAQVMVKVQPIWDKYKLLIVLVLGVFIGWFIFGWGLFPVAWENATPAHMRADYRSAYLGYVATELQQTGNTQLARSRLGLDLPKSRQVPWLADEGSLEQAIDEAVENAARFNLSDRTMALNALKARLPELMQEPVVAEPEAPAVRTLGQVLVTALLVILVLLAAAGGIYYFLVLRAPQRAERQAATTGLADEESFSYAPSAVGEQAPVKSFTTPYVLGDDYFDPSFSIEVGNEFLGECGIGISETLGAGEPKKVTAFEVWLFDKSDIRTVTNVLASEYAFNDPDLRAKLEPKGEIHMLTPGATIRLETTSLRVIATVKDLEYAQGNLPDGSFVHRVNFELTAWVKQGMAQPGPDTLI